MSDHLQIARQILCAALASGPRKGAALKALLIRDFERQTGLEFESVFRRYGKFSEFLRQYPDVFDVARPTAAGGDITISLRDPNAPPSSIIKWHDLVVGGPITQLSPTARYDAPSVLARSFESQVRLYDVSDNGVLVRLPAPLWHAFTNPDSARRRFFHRRTHDVAHYIDGSRAEPNPRIADEVRSDQDYVEIRPASADEQNRWMRRFVANGGIPDASKEIIESLLAVPYTTQLTRTFSAALGPLADEWNRWRALQVRELAEKWASENGVPLSDLSVSTLIEPSNMNRHATAAAPTSSSETELRRFVHQAIDQLSAVELAALQLPAAVHFRLWKDGTR